MKELRKDIQEGRCWLLIALAATFLWGLAAHGYCFLDNAISHDSMREFHGAIEGNDIKMASGRIFVPLYRDLLRSDATLPWLIGILSLLWIALAVFLVVRLFRIESRGLVILTAGIFTINITVSATAATYIHDLDCDMFSLLLAVGAVYLWRRLPWGWLWGSVLIMGSLGIYQSLVFVAVTLVMMLCMQDLLQGVTFQKVMANGLRAIGMILIGGALYMIALKAAQTLTGVALSSGEYNSLDSMLELTLNSVASLSVQAYGDFFRRLLNAYSGYPGILVKMATLLLLLLCAVSVALAMLDRKLGLWEKGLLVVLTALLPLGMNLIYVLMQGMSHDVMVYAIWLTWLLALLLVQWSWERYGHWCLNWNRRLCLLLVAMLLYGTVQFSHGMYMKKDIEYDANLSLMTRVLGRMEEQEGYIPGQTPVYFIGLPDALMDVTPGFKDYWAVTGMESSAMMTRMNHSCYQRFFDYVLCVPLLQVTDQQRTLLEETQDLNTLSAYPARNCIGMYDGILVVKLGEVY